MAEEETQESQEEGKSEKKSGSLVLIIVIVVLILVILVGVVGFILMSGGDEESAVQSAPAAQEQQQVKKRPAGGSENITPFTEIGLMFPMDTFTVNLLSDNGRRYLKVQMNLEIEGEELAAELDTKKAVIRDIIIRLLSSKSLDEISTAKGKDKLKEQITDQLNLRLRDGHINNVYFTEFVIQ